MTAPRKAPNVLMEDVPGTGECVLVDETSGKILALNPTAAAVWVLIDGDRDPAALADVLATATGTDGVQVVADIEAILARLRSEGFVD